LAYPLQKFPVESNPNAFREEETVMGWMMLFWVVLIVAVPTFLWFLLAKRGRDPR